MANLFCAKLWACRKCEKIVQNICTNCANSSGTRNTVCAFIAPQLCCASQKPLSHVRGTEPHVILALFVVICIMWWEGEACLALEAAILLCSIFAYFSICTKAPMFGGENDHIWTLLQKWVMGLPPQQKLQKWGKYGTMINLANMEKAGLPSASGIGSDENENEIRG